MGDIWETLRGPVYPCWKFWKDQISTDINRNQYHPTALTQSESRVSSEIGGMT